MSEKKIKTIIKQFLKSTENIPNSSEKIFSIAYPINVADIFESVDRIKSFGLNFMALSTPSAKKKFIGVNSIWDSSAVSENEINNTMEVLSKNIFSNHKVNSLSGIPFFFSSIKFNKEENSDVWNDFPSEYWFVPEIIFYQNNSSSYLILNFYENKLSESQIFNLYNTAMTFVNSESSSAQNSLIKRVVNQTEFSDWEKIINSSVQLIRTNTLSKIVLSRQVIYEIISKINLFYLINTLGKKYPDTAVFMFGMNNSIFFGATPELLLNISESTINTEALAGSAPRGKSDIDDKRFEDELLKNKKDRNEQKYVVDFIVESLSEVSDKIEFDKTPKVKKLSNIQHLWTTISAELDKRIPVKSLINLIYPTPAICGIPGTQAKQKIIETENHSRGLYSGIIGWLDEKLNGSFYVAIRSALIKKQLLYLYAGCGIVEGSNPESEFDETELKLNPILSLFENEKRD
jgi:menaquinone-specific isochorismate synthase